MTDTLITQCPHCQTSFSLKRSQLDAAQGALRCGACLQVFNPAWHSNHAASVTQTDSGDSGIKATADDLPLFPNRQPAYNSPTQHQPRSRWLLWLLVSSLALLLLLCLYVYSNFAQLARQENSRQWLSAVCPLLGCQLPTKVDVQQIKSSNLQVRSHPEFSGALLIDAIIYNRAPFSQAFPLLKLTFADPNNQALTQRVFTPQEYLSSAYAEHTYMPSQVPIHITLEVLKPSADALNYHLSFISPD